jgi:hypothetical protein
MSSQTDSDSVFEVIVESRTHKKGMETGKRSEHYAQWSDADAAFCAYRDLTKLSNSGIIHVELIEHRRRIVHKAASKEAA